MKRGKGYKFAEGGKATTKKSQQFPAPADTKPDMKQYNMALQQMLSQAMRGQAQADQRRNDVNPQRDEMIRKLMEGYRNPSSEQPSPEKMRRYIERLRNEQMDKKMNEGYKKSKSRDYQEGGSVKERPSSSRQLNQFAAAPAPSKRKLTPVEIRALKEIADIYKKAGLETPSRKNSGKPATSSKQLNQFAAPPREYKKGGKINPAQKARLLQELRKVRGR